MDKIIELVTELRDRLNGMGDWFAPLGLRLILFWEFWEAGREKFSGSNWFMDIQGQFPWPFSIVPSDLSWAMATWAELLGALGLLVGLGTRFFAFSLSVLTIVAVAAVHWPDDWMMFSDLLAGYAITDKGHGNYKLPLIYLIMLLPLIFNGPGKLSLDALFDKFVLGGAERRAVFEPFTVGAFAVAVGLPCMMLLPKLGLALALAGALMAGGSLYLRR